MKSEDIGQRHTFWRYPLGNAEILYGRICCAENETVYTQSPIIVHGAWENGKWMMLVDHDWGILLLVIQSCRQCE